MGEFSHQLLEVNGESGHTYSLSRLGEHAFDMEALNEVRFYVENIGHRAVMGALQQSAEGDVGLIKVLPELSAEELSAMHQETGVRAIAA